MGWAGRCRTLRLATLGLGLGLAVTALGCGLDTRGNTAPKQEGSDAGLLPDASPPPPPPPPPAPPPGADGGVGDASLRLNELVARNQGVWVDELGEADDYIEVVNVSAAPIALQRYRIADSGTTANLPNRTLAPGAHLLVWTDDDPEQGDLHLPFKLSGEGETITLFEGDRQIDQVTYGPLADNDALVRLPDALGEFVVCRYASPGRDNGTTCAPPPPPELGDDLAFMPYSWPDDWGAPAGPLHLSELALRPASFAELHNRSVEAVPLDGLSLTIAPHGAGLPWPSVSEGVRVPLLGTLPAGERIRVPLNAIQLAALESDPTFEGVVTLFDGGGAALDRVDFMHWPQGASLARGPQGGSGHFCEQPSGADGTPACQPLAAREVGERVRHLRTPADLTRLAQGGTALGVESVKFVVDMQAGNVVHLLAAERWPLHYNFVREEIDGDPALDRCDELQAQEFMNGWIAFSQREYYATEGRRFLLGTLNRYAGAGLRTAEFTGGDKIISSQMEHAFFTVAAHLAEPQAWALRPQTADQVDRMRLLDGKLPIVAPHAPFHDLQLQPLAPGVGFGVLRFVAAAELSSVTLGPDVILVTDDVPNDIPLVGGLITEAFQTPLAHVNVLSQARNTPNMALRGARTHPALTDLFGALVRFEVKSASFSVALADPAEAEMFWASRSNAGPRVAPRLDTSVRGLVALADRSLDDLPSLGAKAAQLAELAPLAQASKCPRGFETPREAAAIAIVHSLEHLAESGARARLDALSRDAGFRADPAQRDAGLAEVRALILEHPVDAELLAEVEAYVSAHFGQARVRFRSSSNAEDLPDFSGAGLYTSLSAVAGDPQRSIEDAIRTVWASQFNTRAYDEREYANIAQAEVGMGVLIHEAFRSERANAVVTSRNLLDPTRGDAYYMNLQVGEASVTNPAPGVVTEQLLYNHTGRLPLLRHQSESSLTNSMVMDEPELNQVACVLGEVHAHFRPRIDPAADNPWFAMEVELKRMGDARSLVLKQARPYSFGQAELPGDCREFER